MRLEHLVEDDINGEHHRDGAKKAQHQPSASPFVSSGEKVPEPQHKVRHKQKNSPDLGFHRLEERKALKCGKLWYKTDKHNDRYCCQKPHKPAAKEESYNRGGAEGAHYGSKRTQGYRDNKHRNKGESRNYYPTGKAFHIEHQNQAHIHKGAARFLFHQDQQDWNDNHKSRPNGIPAVGKRKAVAAHYVGQQKRGGYLGELCGLESEASDIEPAF